MLKLRQSHNKLHQHISNHFQAIRNPRQGKTPIVDIVY